MGYKCMVAVFVITAVIAVVNVIVPAVVTSSWPSSLASILFVRFSVSCAPGNARIWVTVLIVCSCLVV